MSTARVIDGCGPCFCHCYRSCLQGFTASDPLQQLPIRYASQALLLQVSLLLFQRVGAGEATLIAFDLVVRLCDPAGEIGRLHRESTNVSAVVIEREQLLKSVDHSIGCTCWRMLRRSMALRSGHGQSSGHG